MLAVSQIGVVGLNERVLLTRLGVLRERAGGPGGLALTAAIGVSSVLSFGFHAAASRLISPPDYSGLAAVLALMAALAVPVGALQTAMTRATAEALVAGRSPSARRLLEIALSCVGPVVSAGCVVAVVATPLLHLENPLPAGSHGALVGSDLPRGRS